MFMPRWRLAAVALSTISPASFAATTLATFVVPVTTFTDWVRALALEALPTIALLITILSSIAVTPIAISCVAIVGITIPRIAFTNIVVSKVAITLAKALPFATTSLGSPVLIVSLTRLPLSTTLVIPPCALALSFLPLPSSFPDRRIVLDNILQAHVQLIRFPTSLPSTSGPALSTPYSPSWCLRSLFLGSCHFAAALGCAYATPSASAAAFVLGLDDIVQGQVNGIRHCPSLLGVRRPSDI
mmetsp:Transcript_27555/g.50469  ORF Transcript_27555/g.50469 Transcript_27555/m.50469 type:complete len:243 (+) Transcript_27555:956-1684(+)